MLGMVVKAGPYRAVRCRMRNINKLLRILTANPHVETHFASSTGGRDSYVMVLILQIQAKRQRGFPCLGSTVRRPAAASVPWAFADRTPKGHAGNWLPAQEGRMRAATAAGLRRWRCCWDGTLGTRQAQEGQGAVGQAQFRRCPVDEPDVSRLRTWEKLAEVSERFQEPDAPAPSTFASPGGLSRAKAEQEAPSASASASRPSQELRLRRHPGPLQLVLREGGLISSRYRCCFRRQSMESSGSVKLPTGFCACC